MSSRTSTPTAVPLLVAGMLLTGICNSLFTKLQDMQCVENCSDPDVSRHVEFSQPVWQTLQMFVGECLCLLPVGIGYAKQRWASQQARGKTRQHDLQQQRRPLLTPDAERAQGGNSIDDDDGGAGLGAVEAAVQAPSLPLRQAFLFFAPAVCDICGTTLMNVGLLFTPVSIYQMTRGALVLWVGVFSVIFLRRHLHLFQWLSLVTVMLGVCIVGLSGTILKEIDTPARDFGSASLAVGSNIDLASLHTPAVSARSMPTSLVARLSGSADEAMPEAVAALLGVLLILFAQLFTATQFVLEEKIMARHDVEPLLAVGYEGIFGLVTVLVAMPVLHFLYGSTAAGAGGYFDMRSGWNQIIHTPAVLWSSVAIALSISLFNGCGLAVTKAISATARSTIDTCRTLGIWVVSLLLGWEVLGPVSGPLQAVGFALLVYGTLVFNGIIRPPQVLRPSIRPAESSRSADRGDS
ncbi:unnamed protein product [Parajaminaea phylloscopi]